MKVSGCGFASSHTAEIMLLQPASLADCSNEVALFNPRLLDREISSSLITKKKKPIGFGFSEPEEQKQLLRAEIWKSFRNSRYLLPILETPPHANEITEQACRPVLLCHTEVYIFADKYGIISLQNLALSKLKWNLESLVIFPLWCADICDLIWFCCQVLWCSGAS